MKPWIIGASINLALAGIVLGIPYARGPQRAEEVVPRFAEFAACFYDAERTPVPGLGLPVGERARFAALVVNADPEWPGRCVELARAIPAEESMFLFPSVKSAEAQLRTAVGLMATELESLAEQRAAGVQTVPHRPTRAMAALRGALAELGISSGVEALSADRDAIVLTDEDTLGLPSIIPLRVSRGGEWEVRLEDGAVLAGTMDSRAAVHVRVAQGGVEQRVTRRPRLVSAMLAAREPPWLTWSTSPSQCDTADGGCAQRSTGLAAFLEDRQTLEPMFWVGAHPELRPSRAIHVQGTDAWVIALTDEAEIRHFSLPEPEVRPLGEEREPPRLDADGRWPTRAGRTAAWLPGEPPAVLVVGSGHAEVLELSEGSAPTPIELLGQIPVARACGTAAEGWLVTATEQGGAVVSMPSRRVLEAPGVRLDPPTEGALDAECHDGGVTVLALDRGRLTRVRCEEECGEPEVVVAENVRAFDGVVRGGELFVAWTDDPEEGVVQLTRMSDGTPSTSQPAACWVDPVDGLCGEPRLVADENQLVLVTRQGEDLRVLRSEDGTRWGSLRGLEQH